MKELIQLFNYNNSEIRTVTKEDNTVWFVALDICKVLDLSNVTKAVKRLELDEVTSIQVTDSLGRSQETNIINEYGLYSLVLSSKKKEAKEFKRWITREVIPQIRKTGSYKSEPEQRIMSPAELALLQAQNVLAIEKKLTIIESKVDTLISDKNHALEQLKIIELPKVLPLQKSERSALNQLIRTYSKSINIDISEAWNHLYNEFLYIYHIDLKQCANNRNISNLDYIESIAKMSELYSVAYSLFVSNKLQNQAK